MENLIWTDHADVKQEKEKKGLARSISLIYTYFIHFKKKPNKQNKTPKISKQNPTE